MIDISGLSDKELFELEKRIKEERITRGTSHFKYKDTLINRRVYGEGLSELFGLDFDVWRTSTSKFIPDDIYIETMTEEYRKTQKQIFSMCDLVCGNFKYAERKGTGYKGTQVTLSLQRNAYVDSEMANRYSKVANEIIDILVREAKITGKIECNKELIAKYKKE